MKKYELYRAEREQGLTYREIAEKYGVSRQNVAQACGKQQTNWFRPYSDSDVVYPNLRRWLNENRVSRMEMLRRLGHGYGASYSPRLKEWLAGSDRISKHSIDNLMRVTGLTYEELFER